MNTLFPVRPSRLPLLVWPFLAVLLPVAGCSGKKKNGSDSKREETPVAVVKIVKPERKTMRRVIDQPGFSEAAVEQAQASLDAARANIATARATVREAEAGRARAQATYERWESEYARIEDLVKRQVIDKQTRDETRNQLKASDAARQEVEAK